MVRRPATCLALMPLNQQRNQLSLVYWTTCKKGGDVTVSCTEHGAISGVACAGEQRKRAFSPAACRLAISCGLTLRNRLRVLPSIRGRISLYSGTWLRFWLMRTWRSGVTAWLGGK